MTDAFTQILLVEDNPDDFEATMRSLRLNHFANPIQWCKNGQEALNFIAKEGAYKNEEDAALPGLICLDLNMPGLDGRQVLERLKTNPKTKQIPVVILTTSADPRDVERCYELGASTYIQKPVTFERLVEAVQTMKDYWFRIAILPQVAV